jgi:transposase
MRGADTFTESLFLMKRQVDCVPAGHHLRVIREIVNKALVVMDGLFADMFEADLKGDCPSVAPEKLLRAVLLQVPYGVRSGRMLMELIQYNMLFR